jgi:hypothetical protein
LCIFPFRLLFLLLLFALVRQGRKPGVFLQRERDNAKQLLSDPRRELTVVKMSSTTK